MLYGDVPGVINQVRFKTSLMRNMNQVANDASRVNSFITKAATPLVEVIRSNVDSKYEDLYYSQ